MSKKPDTPETRIHGKVDVQPYINEIGIAVFTKLGTIHDLVRLSEVNLDTESHKYEGVNARTIFQVAFRGRVRSVDFTGAGAVAWDQAQRDWLITEAELGFIRDMVRMAKMALCGKDWA